MVTKTDISFRITEHDGILVVRDDDIVGGTKQRVLERWLPELGPGEYAYGAQAQGYAYLALAAACEALGPGYRATVFTAKRKALHPRVVQARALGAAIHEVNPGYLSNVQAKARDYCRTTDAFLMPFGFDDPRFIEIMAELARDLHAPAEVWTVAGSGALSRALQKAWPRARFYAVQIGHPPDVGKATLLRAPERFEDDALLPPPFPSCSNYDAKAWWFIKERASPGALFWNVAA